MSIDLTLPAEISEAKVEIEMVAGAGVPEPEMKE